MSKALHFLQLSMEGFNVKALLFYSEYFRNSASIRTCKSVTLLLQVPVL